MPSLTENWSDISGYEGLYVVSDQGNVKSVDRYVSQTTRGGNLMTRIYREVQLIPRVSKNGYKYIHLSKDGKRLTCKIHRLVALTFVPNPYNKPEVNHKDGDKLNNKVSNLEWVTSKENKRHAIDTGLKVNPFGESAHACKGIVEVYNLNGELVDTLIGTRDIKLKGYTPSGVSAVLSGLQSTHRNCKFKLKEKSNVCTQSS